jgi:transcription elongation factor GreA
MNDQTTYLTREGVQKFEEELDYLRTIRRSEVAEQLRAVMQEGGDPGENPAYDEAKNEQSSAEADPVEGKISDVSPLGRALLGRKAGEQVTVKAPRGELTYRISQVKNA